MSQVRLNREASEESEEAEDIFASHFTSSTGKIKIAGSQYHFEEQAAAARTATRNDCVPEGDEKTDPVKAYPGSPDNSASPTQVPANRNHQQEVPNNHRCDSPKQNASVRSGNQRSPFLQKSYSHATGPSHPNNAAPGEPARHHQRVLDDHYSSPEEYEEDTGGRGDVFIAITLSEPYKVGDGISSYMAYRMTTKTNLNFFKRDSFVVSRRFSDFLGLHEKLSDKYLPLGRVIPPAPEKSIVSSTKAKMSSSSSSNNSASAAEQPQQQQPSTSSSDQAEFNAKRRNALERFINRVAAHPVLRRDYIFVEFLESVRELPRATSTSALSSASVFRLFGRVGDTVNKITYKMEENDPWYEEKTKQIDALEAQLKKLCGLAESLAQCRSDLASATGAFSQGAAMLSSTEEAHSLSRALAQLAKVEEKAESVHKSQAEADHMHLVDLLRDYVALVGAVKDVFAERGKIFQNWRHAAGMVTKKKEQRARLEMGGRTDKMPAANEEVTEWEARLDENQARFNQISETIKFEVELFERYRVSDFKTAIIKYLEALMACQLQMVKHWEEFLPEVKNILY